MFAVFLHALLCLLGIAIILFAVIGIWRGLSLRPNQEGHRAPPLSKYYWWAND